MCDHCGCRDLTPVARLMAEHDRLRELTAFIRQDLAAGRDDAARGHLRELLLVLGPHVVREEGRLFPRLRRYDELAEHVAGLAAEHAALYDAVDDLDELADREGWRAGVQRILDDLGGHMFKEDFGLFPAALATLDGADWDDMEDGTEDGMADGIEAGDAAGRDPGARRAPTVAS